MTIDQDYTTGILKISGDLQIEEISLLRDALIECVMDRPSIALDLGGVDFCDTAALQVLIAAQKSAKNLNKAFTFPSVSTKVSSSAAALGLTLSDYIPEDPAGTAGLDAAEGVTVQ